MKIRSFLVVIAVCFGTAAALAAPLPQLEQGNTVQVAIYFDGPHEAFSEGTLDARQILNLLGHFGLRGKIVSLSEYKPGELLTYRAAFFVGTAAGTRFPKGFLEDVRRSQAPFAWMGRHLDQLLNVPDSSRVYGMVYEDYRDDLEFQKVHYKATALPKEDPDLNLVVVHDKEQVQVLATATNNEGLTYPYALRRGKFWYFADIPFSFAEEGGRYLVFCDLLHDVLEVPHASSREALVRMEDVSTDLDPVSIRDIADRMSSRRVPFQLAVIPIFRRPAQGIEVRLTDRPTFIEALQYAVSKGGTPVMHGVTHQYRGVTGDDYEFWNAVENRAVVGDSKEYVRERIAMGLPEMFSSGLFPQAFEVPHYAASEIDYAALLPSFSLFYERTMATADLGSIQFFPYPTIDAFGRIIIPENLGYLPEDNPDPQILIERAKNLRVVRDATASFYFHPFLDPSLLEQAVDGISNLGFRFVSLRQFHGSMNFEGRFAVSTRTGPVGLSLRNEYWRMRSYDSSGKLIREERSSAQMSGSIAVDVEVPTDGWAAIEAVKEFPKATELGWKQKLQVSWDAVRAKWPSGGTALALPPKSALILGADEPPKLNNEKSYHAALSSLGYRISSISVRSFNVLPVESSAILVIPESAGNLLTKEQRQLVLEHLQKGGKLIADGRQSWLSDIGIQWEQRRIPVSRVVDVLFSEMSLQWRPEELVDRFTPPENSRQLMVDPESRQVLALTGSFGNGTFLYLAVPFDAHTSEAISRFPYFSEYLTEAFQIRDSARSPRIEAYFDPGYRHNVDLGRLTARWRQDGVRVIYAAAWQVYPGYSYDYDRLIRLAHQNGIAIYAWFVFPQVTPKMWQERPECRQRTATGTDGNIGWRLQMDFQNEECFREAMDWMRKMLGEHSWDGVNIAELNFDTDFEDYRRADRFVPMSQEARNKFAAQKGFDPALLFDATSMYYNRNNPTAFEQYLQFREDLVTEMHDRVLDEIESVRGPRDWEIIVTMLDSLHSNYVRPALGVNSRRIVELMKAHDFTLQVEDAAEHWMKPPSRYLEFAKTYLPLVPNRSRLMFDVNVMPNRAIDSTTLPSQLSTGMELARTIQAAASASGRAAIYSESTIAPQDWSLITEALASGVELASVDGVKQISTPTSVRVLPATADYYYLDGKLWPASTEDGILIPAGRHEVATERPWYRSIEKGEFQTRLLNISADLKEATVSPTGMSLTYSSPGPAIVVLNRRPEEVIVDGSRAKLQIETGGGRWWITAPRGEHVLNLITTSETGAVINIWSWLSSSAITALGAFATALMLLMYLFIRLRRISGRRKA